MTEDQIVGLGPALTDYLGGYRKFFPRLPTFKHLGTYCRGLLSDLARKSVEPIALAAGAAVRTLQEFLTHHAWDHGRMRDEIQRRVVRDHLPAPGTTPEGGIGTIGWVDETSAAKKGHKTPGVQRQHCGASGKIDNCMVTHFEGRSYKGLIRHMTPCQLVMLFVAGQTTRFRGEKSGGDDGADGAGLELALPALAGGPVQTIPH